ncbi:MAG: hypothetical protein PUF72_02915 [Clostridiales bacterium]|nr:hypothetical protein [Clostridiales bacterium]
MAEADRLNVKICADAQSFVSGIKKSMSALAGFGKLSKTKFTDISKQSMNIASVFQKTGSTIKKALAFAGVAVSLGALKSSLKSAVTAYSEKSLAETKLTVIMRQRMNATEGVIQREKELISTQGKLGIIGGKVQTAGAQQLATFLKQSQSLDVLIPAMNNLLAQQKGVNATQEDAVQIGNLMGKVMTGMPSALRRVGITFSQAQEEILKYGNEEQRAATLAQVIRDNVGDMNEAIAATPVGRWKQLTNSIGGIKTKFGEAAVNLRALLVPALEKIVALLSNAASYAVAASKAIASMFGFKTDNSAASGMGTITDGAEDAADSMENAEDAAKKLNNAVAAFDELNIISPDSTSTLDNNADSIDNIASGMDSTLKKTDELEERMKTFFEGIVKKLEPVKRAVDAIKESWNKVWTSESIEATEKKLVSVFNNAIDLVGSVANAFLTAWNNNEIGTAICQTFQNAVNNVITLVDTMVITLKEAFDSGAGENFFSGILTNLWGILELVNAVASAWTNAWSKVGEEYWESVLNEVGALYELVGTIKKTVADVFNTETGTVFFETIISLATQFDNLIKSFAQSFTEAWKTGEVGKGIITGLVNIATNLVGIIKNLVSGFEMAWNEGSRGETLFHTLLDLGKLMLDFVCELTQDWREVWDEEHVAEIFKGILDSLTEVIENVKTMGQNIYDAFENAQFGKALFSTIRETIDLILSILGSIAELITEMFAQIDWEPLISAVTRILNALGGGEDGGGILGILKDMIEPLKKIGEFFASVFGARLQYSIQKIADVLNTVATALELIKKAWDKVKDFVDKIKELAGLDWDFGSFGSYEPIFGNSGVIYSAADIASSVPGLASGGVVSKETLVRVGEYTGAASNPEIIAPESKIASIVAEQNSGVISAIEKLENTFSNHELTTRISGEDIIMVYRNASRRRGLENISNNFAMGGI